jgi:enoyl-CoA hydratase/carnithine racemase
MGLVSGVAADAEVESAAPKLRPKSRAAAPSLVTRATALADNAPLDAALEFERRACQFLFSTADKNEGMSAFLEKRKPDFAGR